ncbi:MAG: DNA polymerase III subunit beta [Thermoanaerobaculum sp.]|nr:DNA polymerase III subunit beta [Thermoanaerobaculum sp.]
MDVTLNRLQLSQELQLLQGVLERRTTIPILTHVLLTATGDRLELVATDLDLTVFSSCPAGVREEGRVTVHGRVFFDLLRQLPADSLHLRLQDSRLLLQSGNFRSELAVLDPAQYPTLPELPQGQGYALPLGLLHTLVDRAAFAVSAEEGHFQYNAALLNLSEEAVELVGTDGHRLAFVRLAHAGGLPPFTRQLLPRKLLQQLRRLDDRAETPVYLAQGERHVSFRLGERTLLSRLLEARFPQYEKVLIRSHPLRAQVARPELVASLRRVALLSSDRNHGVFLDFQRDSLTVASAGYELGQAAEELPCSYTGEPCKVFVNASYLLDFLTSCPEQAVEIHMARSDAPIVLLPVPEENSPQECLYVLMPIKFAAT